MCSSDLYDFENRMTTNGTTMIVYDGDGNRVSETVSGTTTKYLVDTLNPTALPQVVDETINGAVTRTYAYGLQRISENRQVGGTWTPSFYGYDGHGNVRLLTSSTGSVTDTYTFDAFGRLISFTGVSTPNNYLYSGEQYDPNTFLYYQRARYYQNATGRFWARDPVEGVQCCGMSWNPYLYVRDNPVNASDPKGTDLLEYFYQNFLSFVRYRTVQFGVFSLEERAEFCIRFALGYTLAAELEDPAASDLTFGLAFSACMKMYGAPFN